VRIRFDEWVFDSERRELLQGSGGVRLSPKAFELLGALLASRPRVLSKSQLYDRVWPGTFVTESRLSSVMAELRTALGDDARKPRFVRTVHGYGYAFCGSATEEGPRGPGSGARVAYRIIWNGRDIPLSEGDNVLGRTDDAVSWIEAPTVSRRHARILVTGEGVWLEDLGSKNGTFLSEQRLTSPAPLKDRDAFCLGSEWMTFRIVRGGLSPTRTGRPASQPPPLKG